MTAAIVHLATRRKPRPVTASAAFEEAWLLFPESGRLRSSKRMAYPEWAKVAAEIGENRLLDCVRQYASRDKQHKDKAGAPGFERWLKWGRWEHWLTEPRVQATLFPDATIRAALSLALGEAWCVSWLDRCGLEGDVLIVPGPTAAKAMRDKALVLKLNGLRAMRFRKKGT